ncbi:glycosyltransferase [Vibrio sp. ED004]|uniref:glycosyltransferase n=1 Tax=Vibrio sp. ED004 TaxID=2785124 RepID=UPI00205A73DE|nr:glycosyltransferase [Vibrio sp. ED004]UPR55348.1 glycosyltransferase [Vibrio sp. ED004]
MKSILFVNTQFSTTKSNLLHSQLFSKAKEINKLGVTIHYFGCDYPNNNDETKFLKEKYNFENSSVIETLPKGGVLKLFMNSIRLRSNFREFIKENHIDIVYFRNIFDYLIYSKAASEEGIRTLYDSRSLLFSEVRMKGKLGLPFSYIISLLEKRAIQNSDYLFTVSNKMSNWIKRNWSRESDFTIPCTCDAENFSFDNDFRSKIRSQLKWNESNVIAYCGGTSAWQRIDEILRLFNELYKRNSNYKFLIITRDTEVILDKLKQIDLPESSYYVIFSEHYMVNKWLSVADASIVMREKTLVNEVASPIKIGEYLCLGLPVICTDGIGDYSNLIYENNAGCIIGDKAEFSEKCLTIKTMFEDLKGAQIKAQELSKLFTKDVESKIWAAFINQERL